MQDVLISPVPFGGGTISMTTATSHICHLSGNRFFAVFGQSNPDCVFSSVIEVDDLHSPTPISTVLKQRVMENSKVYRLRVWKLSNNRVIALINTNLVVYEISENNDVTQVASISNFHSTYVYGTEVANAIGLGTHITGFYVKDNCAFFYVRPSTTGAITLKKVSYDETTQSLSSVDLLQSASASSGYYWYADLQKIPGSSNMISYVLGGSSNVANIFIASAMIIDSDGAILRTITGIPTNVKRLIGMANNTIIGIIDARHLRVFEDPTWANTTQYAAMSTGFTSLVYTKALNQDYFITQSTTSSTEIGSGNYSYRISRFISSTFSYTSTATNTNNGVSLSTSNAYFDQDQLTMIDQNTLVSFGRSSPTSFLIRIIS